MDDEFLIIGKTVLMTLGIPIDEDSWHCSQMSDKEIIRNVNDLCYQVGDNSSEFIEIAMTSALLESYLDELRVAKIIDLKVKHKHMTQFWVVYVV